MDSPTARLAQPASTTKKLLPFDQQVHVLWLRRLKRNALRAIWQRWIWHNQAGARRKTPDPIQLRTRSRCTRTRPLLRAIMHRCFDALYAAHRRALRNDRLVRLTSRNGLLAHHVLLCLWFEIATVQSMQRNTLYSQNIQSCMDDRLALHLVVCCWRSSSSLCSTKACAPATA